MEPEIERRIQRKRRGDREREKEKNIIQRMRMRERIIIHIVREKLGELSSKRGQAGTGIIDQTLRLGGAMENSIDWEEVSLNSTDSR